MERKHSGTHCQHTQIHTLSTGAGETRKLLQRQRNISDCSYHRPFVHSALLRCTLGWVYLYMYAPDGHTSVCMHRTLGVSIRVCTAHCKHRALGWVYVYNYTHMCMYMNQCETYTHAHTHTHTRTHTHKHNHTYTHTHTPHTHHSHMYKYKNLLLFIY